MFGVFRPFAAPSKCRPVRPAPRTPVATPLLIHNKVHSIEKQRIISKNFKNAIKQQLMLQSGSCDIRMRLVY